ncbi:MAG: hypothetical protein C0508_28735, partial [Cyanobacteria bacterium PR.023]|nr:hypothetical protein [Cyanobacteria bacterium PR.023]
ASQSIKSVEIIQDVRGVLIDVRAEGDFGFVDYTDVSGTSLKVFVHYTEFAPVIAPEKFRELERCELIFDIDVHGRNKGPAARWVRIV